MTLGVFAPLMAALAGLITIVRGLVQIRSAPDESAADYDSTGSSSQKAGGMMMIGAGLLAPILL